MKKTKCHQCFYEWNTKSYLKTVNCPSCRLKVNNPNFSPDMWSKPQIKKGGKK